MKKTIAISTIGLFLATAPLPVFAQESNTPAVENATAKSCHAVGPIGHHVKSKHQGGHLQALNLTEQQKTAIDSLKAKFKASVSSKKEELMAHRIALKNLLASDKIDRNAVQAEQDKINALSADMANSMVAFRIDMSENLTPEQRKQMRDSHSSWKNKRSGEKRIQRS